MRLKTGVMILKIHLCITGVKLIKKKIQQRKQLNCSIVIIFHNITVLLYFDQINATLVIIRNFFFF